MSDRQDDMFKELPKWPEEAEDEIDPRYLPSRRLRSWMIGGAILGGITGVGGMISADGLDTPSVLILAILPPFFGAILGGIRYEITYPGDRYEL